MESKLFEIRDKNTFIVVLATMLDRGKVNAQSDYLLRRAGFGDPLVQLTSFVRHKSEYDPYDWGCRTYSTAHDYIQNNWYDLKSGDVVDVEFILGEKIDKKESERFS